MRSCLSAQRLRKDVANSHQTIRFKPEAKIFGGQPQPLPKPQPPGHPFPVPLFEVHQSPTQTPQSSTSLSFRLSSTSLSSFSSSSTSGKLLSPKSALQPDGRPCSLPSARENPSPKRSTRKSTSANLPPPNFKSSFSSSEQGNFLPPKSPTQSASQPCSLAPSTQEHPPPTEDFARKSTALKVYRSTSLLSGKFSPELKRSVSSYSPIVTQREGTVPPAQEHPSPTTLHLPPGPSSSSSSSASLDRISFALEQSAASDATTEEGIHGNVYKAWTGERKGKITRVTLVRPCFKNQQGSKDWRSKVHLLSQLNDRHLCELKGYYMVDGVEGVKQKSEQVLVYEHVSHGNLGDTLFGNCKSPLDWRTRLNIALEAARGLAYVHDIAPVEVVYRDFTCWKILLDNHFAAKLAGCGLDVITLKPDKLARASSMVSKYHFEYFWNVNIGTHVGHGSTEVLKKSEEVAKSNIRSFGILLLELLTGKHSRDEAFGKDDKNFLKWAKPHLREHAKLAAIIDLHVRKNYSRIGAMKLAEIAWQCVRKDPTRRQNISEVIEALEFVLCLPNVNDTNLSFNGLRRIRTMKRVHHLPLVLTRTTSNKL